MIRFLLTLSFCLGLAAYAIPVAPGDSGVQGGFVVHLGCGSGEDTVSLRADQRFQVQGLDRDPAKVAAARKHVQAQGLYGTVMIDRLVGDRLPYIDNLVNLLVADSLDGISMEEVMRVLVPRGVALIGGVKTVKPVPDDIDDWGHFLHSASGNAVAQDTVVNLPRHMQWLGTPRWSRHHDRMASMSALVSAKGRMFYIMDEGSRVSIQLPPKWRLVARDAFNGSVLWKRDIPKWQSHLWPLKSGPTALARRLVAVGDVVYVTLGIDAPLTALDAATGETLRSFGDSGSTEEVIVSGDVVLGLVNEGVGELANFAPKMNTGDQGRVAKEYAWDEKPRRLSGYDEKTGKSLWSRETKVAPLTMSSDADHVYYHDGEKAMALNKKTGSVVWESDSIGRKSRINFNFGPKMLVYGDVVLVAGGDRRMTAMDRKTGKTLWSAAHARGGYQSPEDLLVQQGLVWSAPLTSGRDSGKFTAVDVKTGEVKKEISCDVDTYWFHHRCYISKATENFIMPSRTGIEFVDPKTSDWTINHWVRGGCLYGVLPCNGLLYAPPHNCACYPEAKLFGMNALAPAAESRTVPREVPDEGRLEKGPAYADIANLKSETSNASWPTYRGDNVRSGYTKVSVDSTVKPDWAKKLGGRLSTLTAAGGLIYLCKPDEHAVIALRAQNGSEAWRFTAGARVDSPPTIYKGLALFGSMDGWVYALRADNGELAWRFRAAPLDRRHMAFEQLESVWPVHGNILVQDGVAYFVAGRSYYLDGGLRWFKLNPLTGEKLAEVILDDLDPETGKDMQERLMTLQMPVGLPDILSSDGKRVYMRSQQFDFDGKRLFLGPYSGNPSQHANQQGGEAAHLFSPTGFLDDTWFHRSYWVYGRTFAGGHNGYHVAGKHAPSGRILVHDSENVYGFGRKPQYYKWTTTLEHWLFAASKKQAAAPPPGAPAGKPDQQKRRAGPVGPSNTPLIGAAVAIGLPKSLDPTGKAISVEAWVKHTGKTGVVVSRGGPAEGFALAVLDGRPAFLVRAASKLYTVKAENRLSRQWTHLCGVLGADKKLRLYVDGESAGYPVNAALIASDPKQPMDIGNDRGSSVGEYEPDTGFNGAIDEVRVYYRALSEAEVADHAERVTVPADPALVLHLSLDKDGTDASGKKHHGTLNGVTAVEGRIGGAFEFAAAPKGKKGKKPTKKPGGYMVKHHWTEEVPLMARAMVMTGRTLWIAGPPDLMDEEETFKRLVNRDKQVHALLSKQDVALQGGHGGLLWAVNADTGERLAEYAIDQLPVWDGLISAGGKLYMTTTSGELICWGN